MQLWVLTARTNPLVIGSSKREAVTIRIQKANLMLAAMKMHLEQSLVLFESQEEPYLKFMDTDLPI